MDVKAKSVVRLPVSTDEFRAIRENYLSAAHGLIDRIAQAREAVTAFHRAIGECSFATVEKWDQAKVETMRRELCVVAKTFSDAASDAVSLDTATNELSEMMVLLKEALRAKNRD